MAHARGKGSFPFAAPGFGHGVSLVRSNAAQAEHK